MFNIEHFTICWYTLTNIGVACENHGDSLNQFDAHCLMKPLGAQAALIYVGILVQWLPYISLQVQRKGAHSFTSL